MILADIISKKQLFYTFGFRQIYVANGAWEKADLSHCFVLIFVIEKLDIFFEYSSNGKLYSESNEETFMFLS